MKKIIKFTVCCAVSSMLSASALAQYGSQSSQSSGSQGSQSSSDMSSPSSSSNSSSSSSDQLSPTGRSSQQAARATQLIGAEVKDTSGEHIGRIQDIIVNPSSGRIDFGVISLSSGMGSSSSPSGSSSGSSSMPGQSSSSSGSHSSGSSGSQGGASSDTTSSYGGAGSSSSSKMIPVPWSLLQPSASSSSSSSSGSSSYGGQQSFTLSVSRSKLEQAPSLSSGSWSEISQAEWRQRVYSHFGVSDTSTGGAQSPSGSSSGSSSSGSQP